MKVNNSDILERIDAVTLDLIFRYGAKGWTMDTVCKKSGIAKDTLYRIISKKEELIKNALLKALYEHFERLEALLGQDQDFFITLREATQLLSQFLGQFSLIKLSQVFLEYPSIEKAINEETKALFQSFTHFINKGKEEGVLKDTVNSTLLINIMHTCIMQFLKQPELYDTSSDLEILLDYLIEGVRA